MMSKLRLHVKSLTTFVHVATIMTWMTKNDINNGSDFNPHGENLLLCTLKMMKINRQVKFAASYPNLVSVQPCSFMFDTNSWIENNHMKCSSHMAFLFVQNFTLLQKKNWIFCCKFNDKKKSPIFFLNHNFLYRNCQISIYGSSREQRIYKDV